MRIALLSDIHANWQAMTACLEHASSQRIDRRAFMGDLLGYGGSPAKVLDVVMDLAESGDVVLLGNHDEMALTPPAKVERLGDATAQWTHEQLNPAHKSFLQSLPLTAQLHNCLLVHASAYEPRTWRYVTDERTALQSLNAACADPDIRYVMGGHVHHQTLYFRGSHGGLMSFDPVPGAAIPLPAHRRWVATVGSVGQPRDGRPLAMYAVLDLAQRCITFHRVAYDHAGAAAEIRRAGLPDYFATRLEKGL